MSGTFARGGYRRGFDSLDREVSATPLAVSGALPDWLGGSLLRTGPAKFEVGDRGYRHWFDGLAMLHAFAFRGGAVSYSNRFLRTKAFLAAQETGRIGYSEFATDPCRSLFRRLMTTFRPPSFGDNANVNVVRFDDDSLALTETPLPVEFDPQTLETLGVAAPAPGQLTTAHPHRAPSTGELINYAVHFGPSSSYRVYGQREGTKRRMIAQLAVRQPAYMHSFAITERYVVLVEFPFVVNPLAIMLSGRPFIENYRWHPERGTRFRLLDLDTGETRGEWLAEPFFAFHHVNAYEENQEIVLDLCAYQDPEIIDALYLDQLRSSTSRLPHPSLRRYRLRPGERDARRGEVPEVGIELPRIDYERHNGRPYRYVYGLGVTEPGQFPDQIVKTDIADGASALWSEPNTYPGEPVFVRAPGARREDEGVLLSVVLDAAAGTSFLLVLDATTLDELARAGMPHAMPFGIHGDYFAEVNSERSQ